MAYRSGEAARAGKPLGSPFRHGARRLEVWNTGGGPKVWCEDHSFQTRSEHEPNIRRHRPSAGCTVATSTPLRPLKGVAPHRG